MTKKKCCGGKPRRGLLLIAAVGMMVALAGCAVLSKIDLPGITGDKIDQAVDDGKITQNQADKIKDVVNKIDDKIKESAK